MTRSGSASRDREPQDRPFAGDDQPAHRSFHIRAVDTGAGPVPVARKVVSARSFYRHLVFATEGASAAGDVLVVPPISGTFPILMRDVVVGLLADFRVHVIDWTNPRHVPLSKGCFGFGDNIAAILAVEAAMPPRPALFGLCQAGVPTLAATALLAERRERPPPSALVLVGAPIDPDAAPTALVEAIRAHAPDWYRHVVLWPVRAPFAGAGRQVYPAWMQLAAIRTYLANRREGDTEIARKIADDDGADPEAAPFLDLCTSVMDIDGQHFLENLDTVFRQPRLPSGRLFHRGRKADPALIRATALMTVEGGEDDVAAPGHTAAAQALCPALPDCRRALLVDPGSGHFSLFHGRRWREIILPEVRAFLLQSAV